MIRVCVCGVCVCVCSRITTPRRSPKCKLSTERRTSRSDCARSVSNYFSHLVLLKHAL
jgi:hypothetical protein